MNKIKQHLQIHWQKYTKDDMLAELKEMFFKYEIIYKETFETPEDGVWLCNACGVEFGDEHYNRCAYKEEYELIEDFIETRFKDRSI